jgi:hypothetical protein
LELPEILEKLVTVFIYERLPSRIKETLATRRLTTFDKLVEEVKELEAIFPVQRLAAVEIPTRYGKITKLSTEEKKRRNDLNLCLYCGSKEHSVQNCDLALKLRPATATGSYKNRVAAVKLDDDKADAFSDDSLQEQV